MKIMTLTAFAFFRVAQTGRATDQHQSSYVRWMIKRDLERKASA
jgi:hypothetical protein